MNTLIKTEIAQLNEEIDRLTARRETLDTMSAIASASRQLYDSAEFFDADDGQDDLRHDNDDDAIEAALDAREPGDNSPLEIFGFRRITIPPMVLDAEINEFVERLNEQFAEEYADPDSDETVFPHHETCVALLTALKAIKPNIWTCESSGSRVLTEQEVAEWVAKHWPSPPSGDIIADETRVLESP